MTDIQQKKWEVIGPATGEVIGHIEETSIEQVEDIYVKAKNAFQIWSQYSIEQRLDHLRRVKNDISDHMEELAHIVAEDTGKVKVEALVADIYPVLDALDHLLKHAKKNLAPQKVKTPLMLIGRKSYVEYMPRGVVLVISPWNFPFQLAMVPVISALVSGNTVILKPSEVTPLVGKCIEDVLIRSGMPAGVVQVAHGGKELGAALTAGKPDYIFFTGSVRTGQIIQAQAAKDLIPTTLELGGKDPMIVFADANLARAARAAVWGAFTNSGQVCMSIERLYVDRKVAQPFIRLLIDEINRLKQGTDLHADIGSMTFEGQLSIVKEQLEEALKRGAQLETGKKPTEWKTDKGMFLEPMLLTNVEQGMKVVQEEAFGPLLPVIPFDTEEEVIGYANDSIYGLNASVWSSDLGKARRVASQLVSGGVVINDVIISVANHALPFGGAKFSGIGRYHGEGGLRIFCHEKAIIVDAGKRKTEVFWFPYKDKYPLLAQLLQSLYGKRKNWIQFIKSYIGLVRRSQ